MHKIYCFNNGGSPGWFSAVALGDDGKRIAAHICSAESFMKHDLGITSNWKHDAYDAHFGLGNWEVEWVPTDQLDTHEGFKAACELHRKLAEENRSDSDHAELPKIEVEFSKD